MPAVVTPEGFQAHQGFVSRATPELARSLEAALRLPAGGFHRFTAFGLARASRRRVVHPLPMTLQTVPLGWHRRAFRFTKSFDPWAQVIQARGLDLRAFVRSRACESADDSTK